MEMVPENDQIRQHHSTMTEKVACISNKLKLQNHFLTLIVESNSLLSATIVISHSPMAYKTTSCLDKLTCADYVNFGKCQDRFGHFLWSKNNSNYLDGKLEKFKKGDNRDFCLVQNLTMGETGFTQFTRVRHQLVIAAVGQQLVERKTCPQY